MCPLLKVCKGRDDPVTCEQLGAIAAARGNVMERPEALSYRIQCTYINAAVISTVVISQVLSAPFAPTLNPSPSLSFAASGHNTSTSTH